MISPTNSAFSMGLPKTASAPSLAASPNRNSRPRQQPPDMATIGTSTGHRRNYSMTFMPDIWEEKDLIRSDRIDSAGTDPSLPRRPTPHGLRTLTGPEARRAICEPDHCPRLSGSSRFLLPFLCGPQVGYPVTQESRSNFSFRRLLLRCFALLYPLANGSHDHIALRSVLRPQTLFPSKRRCRTSVFLCIAEVFSAANRFRKSCLSPPRCGPRLQHCGPE